MPVFYRLLLYDETDNKNSLSEPVFNVKRTVSLRVLSDSVKERHNLATRTILIDAECTVTEPVRDLVL